LYIPVQRRLVLGAKKRRVTGCLRNAALRRLVTFTRYVQVCQT
jgi:hypothetical protein